MESSSMSSSTPNDLFKSLLYPSYADSGSNEAFHNNMNMNQDVAEQDDIEKHETNHYSRQRSQSNDGIYNYQNTQIADVSPVEIKLTPPPKMMRRVQNIQNDRNNDPVESVASLQISEMGAETEVQVNMAIANEDTDTDVETDIAMGLSSQYSNANVSINTSIGAASSVLGCNFLPPDDGNEEELISESSDMMKVNNFDIDYNDNDAETVNTEAAISGRKRYKKNKSRKCISKTAHENLKPINQDEEDNYSEEQPNQNRIDQQDTTIPNFNSVVQNIAQDDNRSTVEDCSSNVSVMGSEHRSESSSLFEGTVIGNTNHINQSNNRNKKNKIKANRGPGITAELLRAMEEEHEENGNTHDLIESLRKGKDEEKRIRSDISPPVSLDGNDSKDTNTSQKGNRRKKKYIFPMTTPPSHQRAISPDPINDNKTNNGIDMPSRLALPSLDPVDASKTSKLSSPISSKSNTAKEGKLQPFPIKTPVPNSNRNTLSPSMQKIKFSSPPHSQSKKTLSTNQNLLSPLQRVRQCLSVDNDDTISSMYNFNDSNLIEEKTTRLWRSTSSKNQFQNLETSKSWDVGGNRHFVFHTREELKFVQEKNIFPSELCKTRKSDSESLERERTESDKAKERFLRNHEFSPAVRKDKNFKILQSSQRIEFERDDALNLLACLVERSLAFQHHSNDTRTNYPSQSSNPSDSTLDEQSEKNNSSISAPIEALRFISQFYEQNPPKISPEQAIILDHSTRIKALDNLLSSQTYALEMKRAALGASKWLDTIRISSQSSSKSVGSTHLNLKSSGQNKISKGIEDVDELRGRLTELEQACMEKEEYSQRLNEELSKCRAEIGRLKSSARAEVLFTSPNRSILDFDDDEETSASSASPGVKDDFKVLESAFNDVSDVLDVDAIKKEEKREIILLKAELQKYRANADQNKDASADNDKMITSQDFDGKKETDLDEDNNEVDNENDKHEKESIENEALPYSIYNEGLVKELEEYEDAIRKEDKAEIKSLKQQLQEVTERLKNIQDIEENQEMTRAEETCLTSPASPTRNMSQPQGSQAQSPTSPNDEKVINVRMLDAENFVTEWDSLAQPLPPPPDHGLHSPIVDALLKQWTPDTSMHDSLLLWMEKVMAGDDPSTIPPLQIASLDHQVRDGFAMHVLPLLLRRGDINVKVNTRAHRATTYDIAVAVTKAESPDDTHCFESAVSPRTTSQGNGANSKHMMAFKASNSAGAVVDAGGEVEDSTVRKSVNIRSGPGFWRSNPSEIGNSSVTSTSITSPVSNRDTTRLNQNISSRGNRVDDFQHHSNISKDSHNVPSSGLSEGSNDESVGSSITGTSSQKSIQNTSGPGIMSAIGGAFGGFLTRNKKPSSFDDGDYDHNWTKNKDRVYQHGSKHNTHTNQGHRTSQKLSPINTAPSSYSSLNQTHSPISSHQPEEEDHPYHRVVSAPAGRIGVTFVQFRGHAMVSDISPDSPLSGWVFPSDILIAIDEVPVSGMRVRDIVKLLTARVDRQRALRMISTHAMEELTQPASME